MERSRSESLFPSLFGKTGILLIMVIVIGSNNNKNNDSMLRMSDVLPELLNVNIIVTQRSRCYYHHLIVEEIELKYVE